MPVTRFHHNTWESKVRSHAGLYAFHLYQRNSYLFTLAMRHEHLEVRA